MQVPEFILEKKRALKELSVWRRMTAEEKADFLATTSEVLADNKITSLCIKYL